MQKACQLPESAPHADLKGKITVEGAPFVKSDVTKGAWRLSAQAARRSLSGGS